MLCRLPQPIQTCQPRKRWSGYQVRSLLPRRRSRSREDQPSVREAHPGRREDSDRWYVNPLYP